MHDTDSPTTPPRSTVHTLELWHAGWDGWRGFAHLRDGRVLRLEVPDLDAARRLYAWFTGRTIPTAELLRRSLRRELNAWRASWERLLPDVQRRIAALEVELATLADWRHCRCGRGCEGCGGCRTLSVGCGWCRCDGYGRVPAETGYEAQLAAEEAADRRALRRRIAAHGRRAA